MSIRYGLLLAALAPAVLAAQGTSKGAAAGGKQAAAPAAAAKPDAKRSDEWIIQDWYGKNPKQLPPGLAKKETLPPGLAKQLRKNGTLPPGLQKRLTPLPAGLVRVLPPLPRGHERVILIGMVIVLDRNTSKIVDIVKILAN